MATRIALVFAGGVPLGVYQAGVAHELLWALSHHIDPEDPVYVDVLTGASAGSMTAALLAHALLHDPAAAANLHRAWVSEISFDGLMAGQPTASLFSDRLLWELAGRLLPPTPDVPIPHPAAPPELRMAFRPLEPQRHQLRARVRRHSGTV